MYLYHWPIYQIIRKEAGIGLTPAKFALAMAITLPLTELSYRYIEMPVRQGRLSEWFPTRRCGGAAMRVCSAGGSSSSRCSEPPW